MAQDAGTAVQHPIDEITSLIRQIDLLGGRVHQISQDEDLRAELLKHTKRLTVLLEKPGMSMHTICPLNNRKRYEAS